MDNAGMLQNYVSKQGNSIDQAQQNSCILNLGIHIKCVF